MKQFVMLFILDDKMEDFKNYRRMSSKSRLMNESCTLKSESQLSTV